MCSIERGPPSPKEGDEKCSHYEVVANPTMTTQTASQSITWLYGLEQTLSADFVHYP